MIKLFNVTKRFGSIDALRDVSLSIGEGEFVLLSGPSGAGKTTLLRTIFAAERPDAGQIVLAGRNISRLQRSSIPLLRRSIGVVFQDFKLLSRRSTLQNVVVALEIRGMPSQQARTRGMLALSAVGLEARAHAPVSALSGGEQQRVAIARAMVGSPAILLADEPTGNLDPERSHDILDLLELEAQRGTTIVVATHDPMVVQNAAAHRVVLMDRGAVVGELSGSRSSIRPPRAVDAAAPAVDSILSNLQLVEGAA
jgi:cell division transport system ATP-binding protein